MNIEMLAGYRAQMFDADTGSDRLRQGWRALRLYGRKAKMAIITGDDVVKAQMIDRADRLLTLLTGILETGSGATLGPLLMYIYAKLHMTLLHANLNNDASALDDFETAITMLARQMEPRVERPAAA